jgi:flagellin
MSLVINTNVSALNAYRNLNNNQNMMNDAIEKLSSGLRINKAADDAAGLSISQGLSSQINGLSQAVTNAQDATDVAQIADGALGTAQQILQRMRTLTVQAGNSGTQDTTSLTAIGSEMKQLNAQLDSISTQTKYGNTALLSGTYNGTFQVGANSGDTIALDLTTAKSDSVSLGTSTLALSGNTGTYTNAQSGTDLNAIDLAIGKVSTARSNIGATQNQLSYTTTNLQTAITNVTASRSNLTDADLAVEVTAMTQAQILTNAATSVLAQANSAPQAILKLLQ